MLKVSVALGGQVMLLFVVNLASGVYKKDTYSYFENNIFQEANCRTNG